MIAPNQLIDADGNAKPPQPPKPGESTRAQGGTAFVGGRVGSLWGPNSLYATTYSGAPNAPFNLFPDGVWYSGSYETYRLMKCHPIIALAESIITAPIEAGAWSYKKRDDDVPDEWVDFIEEQFEAIRPSAIPEMLEAVTLGNQPFEIVWANRDGRLVIDYLKPLLPEKTSIVVDKSGRFAGITQGGIGDRLDPYKSWVYAHKFRTGNYYGLSRLEQVRETAWADWLHTMAKKRQIKEKLSGIIPIIYHPPGAPAGAAEGVTYQTQCLEAARALTQQRGVVIETLALAEDEIINRPELLKESLIKVDFYNAGNLDTGGMIDDLTHSEMLMFAGMLRSARTGLESQNGSRADAEQHTDTGVNDSARIDREIARQINGGPVDAALVLNFGPQAKGAVYIEPAPLVDRKREVLLSVFDKLLAMPGVGDQLANVLDVDRIIDDLEVNRKGEFDGSVIVPPLRGTPNAPAADPNQPPADPTDPTNADPVD